MQGKQPTSKNMLQKIIGTLLLLATTSCASELKNNYVGRTYPATTRVEIFVDWTDLPRSYETMGYITVTGIGALFSRTNTPAEAQKRIEEIARQNGADAIVIGPAARQPWAVPLPPQPVAAAGDGTTVAAAPDPESNTRLDAAFIKYKTDL